MTLGAGSTVFAKNVLGKLLSPALRDSEFALYDIDHERLLDSEIMLNVLNKKYGTMAESGLYRPPTGSGWGQLIINAIQVGGYKPSTVIDFSTEKYGFRQTIADIRYWNIFRALRTLPVMFDFARDMEEVCPDVSLNHTNPMAIVTGAMLCLEQRPQLRQVQVCRHLRIWACPGQRALPYRESTIWSGS